MYTKNLKLIPGLLAIVIGVSSCSSDDDGSDGNWVEKSIFDGTARSSAVSFTIGDKGYVGTGYNGDDYLKDFWVYDINGNFWTQVADFPGIERSAAAAFTNNNIGYVGTGFDGDDELADFYSYNPETNTWSQIADLAIEGSTEDLSRRGAVAFTTINGGYLGTGYDGENDKKDFYEYSIESDSWEVKPGFGGEKRTEATTFTINDIVYLATGTSNGEFKNDLWAFDINTELWSTLNDLDDDDDGDDEILRSNAVGFNLNGRGYITSGITSSDVSDTIWEYDPLDDSWDEINELEGQPRQDAISISNGLRAYVGLGRFGSSLYYDDIYEIFPDEEEDDED